VIAPAKTGRERRRSTAVILIDQTNRGSRSNSIPCHRILIAVVIKFTELKMEDTPAKWREKIVKSTDPPAWARLPARGG
jgi:hypothetical protein